MNGSGGPAGLLRRLGALFYDALLLAAVLMIVTALFLPLNKGEAITPQTSIKLEYGYRICLLSVLILYYGIAWTRSGQTLGMSAWKIRALRTDGTRLRWQDVLLRIAAGAVSLLPLGLGYLWLLIDRQKLTWHDRLSGTRIVAA